MTSRRSRPKGGGWRCRSWGRLSPIGSMPTIPTTRDRRRGVRFVAGAGAGLVRSDMGWECKPSPRITHCVGAAFSSCRRSAPHTAQHGGSEHGGPCGLASYRIRALPPRVRRRPCESFSLNMRAHQVGFPTITRIALIRSFAQVSTSPASISAGRSLRARQAFPWPTCRGQPPAISRRAG